MANPDQFTLITSDIQLAKRVSSRIACQTGKQKNGMLGYLPPSLELVPSSPYTDNKELLQVKLLCFDMTRTTWGRQKGAFLPFQPLFLRTSPPCPFHTSSHPCSFTPQLQLRQSSPGSQPTTKHRLESKKCHAASPPVEQETRNRGGSCTPSHTLMAETPPSSDPAFMVAGMLTATTTQDCNLPCTPSSSDAYPGAW